MCDTLFAAREVTRDNISLFAKNSDRQPISLSNSLTPSGAGVHVTRITILDHSARTDRDL